MSQNKSKYLLSGGLGNQLFIYAAGHFNSFLDQQIEFYGKIEKSSYLNSIEPLIFNCIHKTCLRKSNKIVNLELRLTDMLSNRISKRFRKVRNYNSIGSVPEEIIEKYHRGFFQNHVVVDAVWPSIQSEIESTLHTTGEIQNLDIPKEFQIMHIRRGDYMQNSETIGVLSNEYYLREMKRDLPLVVTTDDLIDHYYEETFETKMVFQGNSLNAWQVLNLLSKAKRIYAANSTLSWWGAYIAKKTNNLTEVVLPKPWFKNKKLSGEVKMYFDGATTRESLFS
jgi:hypothetical protein